MLNKLFGTAFLSLVIVSVTLARQATPAERLLDHLRIEREMAVTDPSRSTGAKPQIDLKPLVGLNRTQLLQNLGAPNVCLRPDDAKCVKSTHLAYFYYPYVIPPAKDIGDGLTEITVKAGGGWALEVSFAHDSVNKASWVKQE